MRKLLNLTLFIIISLSLIGQKNKSKDSKIPAFGSVDKADLELKECDFDKNAEAMILFDKGELEFISGIGINLVRHTRIKILTDKGKDNADIHLPYHSYQNDEDIKDISAQIYNLDPSGNIVVTKVDKKQVFEKKINKRYSEKVFTFPEVKAGSIIEYKYKHTSIGLINWYFQRSIPVRYSEFTFDYPDVVEMAFTPKCYLPFESRSGSNANRTNKFFSMENIPGLRNEPYIINDDDYLQKIESKPIAIIDGNGKRENLLRSWPGVIKELMEDEDFGIQIKKDIPRTTDLDLALRGVTDHYQRMNIIFEYVKKNMEWNGNPGIWALDGVKSAWKDKKGTVGEINLILVNLLKDAGVNAKPMLVSTHDNGLVATMDAGTYFSPGYLQFNKVIAYVKIDKDVYFLDATNKETPVNLIPPDMVATEGLVIEKIETYDWGWEYLWKDNMTFKNLILLTGSIDDKGSFSGSANINSFDYARLDRIAAAKKGTKEFTEQYLSSANPGVNIDSISFENIDIDTFPLIQKVFFNQQVNESGDYRYFSINLFTGLEKNPFVADSRISDVFFGVNQFYSLISSVIIPEGYEFDALPKNLKMIMPDTSIVITRVSQVSNNILNTRMNLEFKKPYYSPQEYEELKEFYKRLYDLLNEQYVIHKKAKA